ncbi:MAG: hypothetical protein ABW194_05655 [Novosphingobium sp.]
MSPVATRSTSSAPAPFAVSDAPDDRRAVDHDDEGISSPRGLVIGLVLSAAVWSGIALLIF